MACATTKSDFDIFVKRPVQSAVLWSRVKHYKPIAPVHQSDLEFVIPGEDETYVFHDTHTHMPMWGKLVAHEDSVLNAAESMTVFNNLIYSLFNQYSITQNGASVSSSKYFYN